MYEDQTLTKSKPVSHLPGMPPKDFDVRCVLAEPNECVLLMHYAWAFVVFPS